MKKLPPCEKCLLLGTCLAKLGKDPWHAFHVRPVLYSCDLAMAYVSENKTWIHNDGTTKTFNNINQVDVMDFLINLKEIRKKRK